MRPAESDVLASIADLVSKARQGGVSLVGRESHRLAEDVAPVNIVLGAETVIQPGAELVVGSSLCGIHNKVGRAGPVWRREERSHFLENRVDAFSRNPVPLKCLAGGAKGRIRTSRGIDDPVGSDTGRRVRL